MFRPETSARRRFPAPVRGRTATRRVPRAALVLALATGATFGLSACRSIGPGADQEQAKATAATTPTAGMTVPTPTPTATPTPEPTPSPAATQPTTPTTAPASSPVPTDPASGATATPTPDTTPTRSATNATTGQPRKVKVSDPWRLVGQPYLLDNDSPDNVKGGKTTYTLWFRTRGDFRGVRAGTPLTDPRHYKIGDITIQDLPGLIRTGQGNLRLADRTAHPDRYCWSGIVNVMGAGNNARFAVHAANTTIPVEFNLHGSPAQTKTASFVVRPAAAALQPAQTALGCH